MARPINLNVGESWRKSAAWRNGGNDWRHR
jgi:hypothetical protein